MVKSKAMGIHNDLVSVIIPTYNRASLLSRAIQSVLQQRYGNFELIIVDDSSTDNTKDVVLDLKDERIIYIRHDKNKGGSAARNSGIRLSRGEYIAFLDDDDVWLPDKLESQLKRFKEVPSTVGLVYCGYRIVSSEKIISVVKPEIKGRVFDEALKKCFLGGPTPVIKRECFDKAGIFDEKLPSCQDWDIWIRVAKHFGFDYVPEILAEYRIHKCQVSAGLQSKIEARKRILGKYEDELKKRAPIFALHLRRLGSLYCLSGNPNLGRSYILKSIRVAPFLSDGYIHLFLLALSNRIYKKLLLSYGVQKVGDIVLYH